MFKIFVIGLLANLALAENFILDYKCMPNIACAVLMGGIKKTGGDSNGIGYLNGMKILGTSALHRSSGVYTNCAANYCDDPPSYNGNKPGTPPSSMRSCFEYPFVNTAEASPDGYKRCISTSEHTTFHATLDKYFLENAVTSGSSFYVTLINIPAAGCDKAYI